MKPVRANSGIAGSVGSVARSYAYNATCAGGKAMTIYRKIAVPASTVKIGAPARAATTTRTIHGQPAAPSKNSNDVLSHTPAASAAPAHARGTHPPARHVSRTAITPNDTGKMSRVTHVWTPRAISEPMSRSIATTSIDARARMAQTATANAAAKARVTWRNRPSGMNVPVDSATSFSCRAARPAPRNATQRVRCWTNGIDPGIPPATRGRTTISASGRMTIAANANVAASSSIV